VISGAHLGFGKLVEILERLRVVKNVFHMGDSDLSLSNKIIFCVLDFQPSMLLPGRAGVLEPEGRSVNGGEVPAGMKSSSRLFSRIKFKTAVTYSCSSLHRDVHGSRQGRFPRREVLLLNRLVLDNTSFADFLPRASVRGQGLG
jgi:hypothetical protein